jgi:hypothetical protein
VGSSKCVDLGGGFVSADAEDAGETHGEAAGMAVAGLDAVESDFEDDLGVHFEVAAVLAQGGA